MAKKREVKGVANINAEVKEVKKDPGKTTVSIAKELEQGFIKKQAKKTMEQTHIRTTFLLDRELSDKLNMLSAQYGRGFKTEFLNKAISELLKQF